MQRALARVEGQVEHRPRWEVRLTVHRSDHRGRDGTSRDHVLAGARWCLLRLHRGQDRHRAAGRCCSSSSESLWPRSASSCSCGSSITGGRPSRSRPPARRHWSQPTGTVGASLLFGWYLSKAAEFGTTVGALGGFAFALLWLYIGALATIIGARHRDQRLAISRDRGVPGRASPNGAVSPLGLLDSRQVVEASGLGAGLVGRHGSGVD